MSEKSVSARLTEFARSWSKTGVPAHIRHEANRLLVNQLKASVNATNHPAITILRHWAQGRGGTQDAHIFWLGDHVDGERAAIVNAALFEVLDFNETHIPTFQHAVSGVLPAVLVVAERLGSTGHAVLDALALGIEAELAIASILIPSAYYRGFVPGGLTGAIGGAVACGLLGGLDDTKLQNAIGLAMNMGAGTYQSAGSMALPFIMGMTARAGLNAYELAAAGIDAPALAFEGDKGMLSSYSDAPSDTIDKVLGGLDGIWRIMRQSYKTVPTETITHAPIECVLAMRDLAKGRRVKRLCFGVSEIVVKIATERAERFGAPTSDLEARFDLFHCAAAAWVRGRFTLAEMAHSAYGDPEILDLRSRIDLIADAAHPTFEGASLKVDYTDGSFDTISVPFFRGTPPNPMTDEELSAVFRQSAMGVLSPRRIEAVLSAAWSLDQAANVSDLMKVAVIG